MDKIVSIAEAKASIPVGPKDDQIRSLFASIDHATLRIASALRTDFAAGSLEDIFLLDQATVDYANGVHKFALTNGFLSATPVVKVAATFSGIATAEELTEGVRVDLNKGLVSVCQTFCSPVVVSISYAYGFEAGEPNTIELTDTTELVETVYQDAPEWLKAVVIAHAYDIYRAMREPEPKASAYRSKAAITMLPTMSEGVRAALQPKLRYFPDAHVPSVSV